MSQCRPGGVLFVLFCFCEKAFNYKINVFGIYGAIQINLSAFGILSFLRNLSVFKSELLTVLTESLTLLTKQPCRDCGKYS